MIEAILGTISIATILRDNEDWVVHYHDAEGNECISEFDLEAKAKAFVRSMLPEFCKTYLKFVENHHVGS